MSQQQTRQLEISIKRVSLELYVTIVTMLVDQWLRGTGGNTYSFRYFVTIDSCCAQYSIASIQGENKFET